MQPYIEEVSIKGFKSFSKPVRIKLEPAFGVIVGPNGSGKSNVLDSLCFTLGRLSTKSLRADNYSELISRNKSNNSPSEVSITLFNDGSFPIDTDKLKIQRRILPSGQTKYRMNGKNATRKEVLNTLSRARVLPEGHNIILQGDVNRFVDMTALERRRVIEEISGIVIYEDRKGKAVKELDKVKEKLKDAQIVLREKENYMDNLKSEKDEAAKYKDTIDDLRRHKFTLLNLKLDSKKKSQETVEKEVETIEKEVKKFQDNSSSVKKNIDKLREELNKLEDKIEEMGGGERLTLQKKIEELKVNIEKSKNLEENSKNELVRIENRQKQLKANLGEISKKITVENNKIKKFQSQKSQILSQEKKIKEALGEDKIEEIGKRIDSLEENVSELKEKKLSLQEKIHELQSNIDKREYKLEDISNRLDKKSKKSSTISSEKKRYKELIQNIGRLVHEDSKIAVEIGRIKKEVISIEDELSKIRVEDKFREQFILRNKAIKTILDAKKKKKIPGIHGTVTDLGRVDDEYSLALEITAGYKVMNVVVDNADIAVKCLNLLKRTKSGVSTFLPLTKIKSPHSIPLPKQQGVIDFAFNLIECNPKYNMLFKYVFGNTVIVKDIDTAKSIGIGKYRMVTLSGDVFNPSGAIQGGYRSKRKGLGFKTDDLSGKVEEVSGRLDALKDKKDSAEREREEIEKKLENLRKEKAGLEGKIESYEDEDDLDLSKEKENLENELKELRTDKSNIESKIKNIENNISENNSKLLKEKDEISNLKSKEAKDKLENIRENRVEVESKLAQSNSVVENTLIPEKENIHRVLKELVKEKESFEKQIVSEKEGRKKLVNELNEKEKKEGSFYSKLKNAFKRKNEISHEIQSKESKLSEISRKISEKNERKNNIVIRKAKSKAEVDSLEEELKEFKDVKALKESSISKIRSKVIQLEDKMQGFGQVNLKALQKWKELKKEFEDLTWKIGKLDSEREDIQKVIDKIEIKKKEVFLEVFGKISKNFKEIFNKISSYTGELELEKKRDPFEGGVRIEVKNNKGKRVPIASLSGGEKVLTALALIFSIQEMEPAPFYLMDEIDAALDKVNSEKVAKLLKEYSKKAQVIMVSHNDSIISEADQLYGVSMNNGISSIISLKV